jgi:ribosomal protein S12 methylthiotransferase accessory factor
MPLHTTFLNERIELLEGVYDEERARQLVALTRAYNRRIGPITSVNLLRPELMDLSMYSAYCHHVPFVSLIRDLATKWGPTASILPGGGKGIAALDALLGAFGEMAERLLGTVHCMAISNKIVHATYDHLIRQGHIALGPQEMPLFAPEQYARPKFEYSEFREDSFLGWVEGTELLTGDPILVPAQLVLMYYKPHPDENLIGYATTAGGAFHTSRSRGLLHGLYEVIERDAVNINWYCRLRPPHVKLDLHSILPAYFRPRQVRMSNPHISEVQVCLATLDTPVTVLTAIAVDKSRQERAFLGGSGASPRRERALAQAVFEVGQCQTGFRCDNPFGRNPIYEDSDSSEVVEFFDAPLYFGFPKNLPRTYWFTSSKETVSWEQVPTWDFKNDMDELDAMAQWLVGKKHRPIVFDFSSACWPGVSITKIFVPSLTQACPPLNPMLGHSRFYELPEQLRFTDRLLTFDDLSSDPIPFA